MEIEVFHTCKTDGDVDFVLDNAPFLSEANNRQWLTQGHYFWVELIEHAKHWGRNAYDGNYAIISATLVIDGKPFLDLVGSPKQIDFFRKLMSKYMNFARASLGKDIEPKVSKCIQWYRDKEDVNTGAFPFIGIRATEKDTRKVFEFIESADNQISLDSRQQICLFKDNKECITNKALVYPEQWVA